MKYIFGPVNSRRLGRSVGINLVPSKLCSFDCVYCECGCTTALTSEIREYVPYDKVVSEIDEFISGKPEFDCFTFSGSGEPTLNSRIGDIIDYIKSKTIMQDVVVLTNSSTMTLKEVRERLLNADIVIPTLNAVSADIFNEIMRPSLGIEPWDIIEGLIGFRKEYKGLIYLEVFIVPGLNDNKDELVKIRDAAMLIKPDQVHINHLDRPGAEEWVRSAELDQLTAAGKLFYPLHVKILSRPVITLDPD